MCEYRIAELHEIIGKKKEPARKKARDDDHGERGQNPAHTPLPKLEKLKLTLLEILENEPGDEIARNDKEDIDADVAAAKTEVSVEKQYGQDGNGPEAVDVRPILSMTVYARR